MRPNRGVTWVETLPDAVDFIREAFGIPEMLDSESSQAYRTLWRERFLPPKHRTLHRCSACNGKRRIKHYFDWDSLFTSPLIHLRHLTSEAEITECLTSKRLALATPVALFFERCDLPVFVLPFEVVQRPVLDAVDLYLAPLKNPTWTLVYTHEEWVLYAERMDEQIE